MLRNTKTFVTIAMVLTLAIPVLAYGEDPIEPGPWSKTLEAGLNLTQSAYSDNWNGGDQGQFSWTLIANAEAKRQMNEKFNWSHVLKLAYGQTSLQGDNRSWSSPNKSTDLIDYETIGRFTLGMYLDPYASARLESQFLDQSDALGRSTKFNPVLLKQSFGVAHEYIGEENRSLLVRLGGTFREGLRRQFTSDVDPDDTATSMETSVDGGLELVIDYKNVFFEDAIGWTSKLSFYQPFFYSGKSDFEDLDKTLLETAGVAPDVADFTTTMDIDWENIFTGQVTKYLSVNLYVQFVYDKYDNSVAPVIADDGTLANPGAVLSGIRKKGQFKQTLALGLTYRFF